MTRRSGSASAARLDIWVHGSLLAVGGSGVLLRGAPGVGKSHLALELLERGHGLSADDVVRLRGTRAGALIGSAPANTTDVLMLRTLGPIAPASHFGDHALVGEIPIDMVVELVDTPSDALTGGWRVTALAGFTLDSLHLPTSRASALAVEVGAREHRLGKPGRARVERHFGMAHALGDH